MSEEEKTPSGDAPRSGEEQTTPMPGAAPPAGEEQTAATAADEVPVKVCPHCSVQTRTDGDYCPHCGASYVHGRKGLSPKAKRIVAAVIAVVLLAGAGTAVALKVSHDNKIEKQRKEAAARKRAAEQRAAAERAAAEAEQERQDALDDAERSERRRLVRELRKSISKDARQRVAEGVLDGPIYGTQCDFVSGSEPDDLSGHRARYDCLAINKKNGDGTVSGWRFSASVDFKDFSYRWRLGAD